jgi:hypothetical protein
MKIEARPAHYARQWGCGARSAVARDVGHDGEPDPVEMVRRYGAQTSVLDWRESPRVLGLRKPSGRYGGHRDRAAIAPRLEALTVRRSLPRAPAPIGAGV